MEFDTSSHRLAILFVDDEVNNCENFHLSFRRQYRIYLAYSSKQALQILESQPDIGLVISDYQRPLENGLQFLITVKQQYPQIVRIMISASCHTFPKVYEKVQSEAQVFAYFIKPWDHGRLSEAIEEAMRQGSNGVTH